MEEPGRFNPLHAVLLLPSLSAALIAARLCGRSGRAVIKAEMGEKKRSVFAQIRYIMLSVLSITPQKDETHPAAMLGWV